MMQKSITLLLIRKAMLLSKMIHVMEWKMRYVFQPTKSIHLSINAKVSIYWIQNIVASTDIMTRSIHKDLAIGITMSDDLSWKQY